MIAETENLTRELTQDGKLILEPGYLGYLRGMGYQIDSVEDIDTVESDSNAEKSYLVAEIETFDKPKDHPRLDYVSDRCTIYCCSCWQWRNEESADLTEEKPSDCGMCKHLRKKYKVARAKDDKDQTELV